MMDAERVDGISWKDIWRFAGAEWKVKKGRMGGGRVLGMLG
jgi:hypothetical protein